MKKQINSALISVYNKDGLDKIIQLLFKYKIKIISTGGTADFIRKLKIPVVEVETITKMPPILGGRVKTLEPHIFGAILNRRDNKNDQKEKKEHEIENIDLVIVDLYPFKETLAKGGSEEEIIEKIDIGGVALIRAAAKNFKDVVVIPSKDEYQNLIEIFKNTNATTLEERKRFAGKAFEVTSEYDLNIREFFQALPLRYGENPHQKGKFIGNLKENFI